MTIRKLFVIVAALALALGACGGSTNDAGGDGDAGGDTSTAPTSGGGSGDVAAGAEVYQGTCIACHGPNGEGIEGLGLPFDGSDFVSSSSEDELVEFIKVGRPASDPVNTTGVDMPPKGGNPSLTDEDLHNVAAYIKSLN